jgi:hypothetical protein
MKLDSVYVVVQNTARARHFHRQNSGWEPILIRVSDLDLARLRLQEVKGCRKVSS